MHNHPFENDEISDQDSERLLWVSMGYVFVLLLLAIAVERVFLKGESIIVLVVNWFLN